MLAKFEPVISLLDKMAYLEVFGKDDPSIDMVTDIQTNANWICYV